MTFQVLIALCAAYLFVQTIAEYSLEGHEGGLYGGHSAEIQYEGHESLGESAGFGGHEALLQSSYGQESYGGHEGGDEHDHKDYYVIFYQLFTLI